MNSYRKEIARGANLACREGRASCRVGTNALWVGSVQHDWVEGRAGPSRPRASTLICERMITFDTVLREKLKLVLVISPQLSAPKGGPMRKKFKKIKKLKYDELKWIL